MKTLHYFLVLLFLLVNFSFSQSARTITNYHPFSGSFAITGEAGITYPKTDFKTSKLGFLAKGNLEYFFPSKSVGAFGLRLFGGGGDIAGKDGVTGKFPNIKQFKTNLFFFGGGAEYTLNFGVVNPYIFAGASYLNFNPKDEIGNKLPGNASGAYKKNEINYNGEVGIRFLLSKNLTFNLSGATSISPNDVLDDFPNTITNGKSNDLFYSLTGGFTYYFIPKRDEDNDGVEDSHDMCPNTPPGVTVDEFGCPIDSDNDGVPDYKDKCPNTPANIKVDANGCPLDSDKDGVPDYKDKCANTPANVKVDNNGCPIDSDGDGVPDYKDKCPNTSQGAKVDSVGCEIVEVKAPVENKKFILSGSTNFEFGKAALTPNAKKILSRFVKIMKENPDTRYKIEGYTDNVGSYAYNKKLSLRRAEAVLNYFVEQGLNRARFEVYGRGPENPIGDNELEYGRALNRRVTITDVNYVKEKKSSSKEVIKSHAYDYSKDKVVEGTIFTDGNLYTIQVSSWETRRKAEKEAGRLRSEGHNAVLFKSVVNGKDHYRVRIGYFQSVDDAKAYIEKYFAPKK